MYRFSSPLQIKFQNQRTQFKIHSRIISNLNFRIRYEKMRLPNPFQQKILGWKENCSEIGESEPSALTVFSESQSDYSKSR